MKRKVLAYRNLPTRLPAGATALAYVLLDRFQSPTWVWAVIGTVISIGWIVGIVDVFTQQIQTDIFEDSKR